MTEHPTNPIPLRPRTHVPLASSYLMGATAPSNPASDLAEEPQTLRVRDSGYVDVASLAGIAPGTTLRAEATISDDGKVTELRLIPIAEPEMVPAARADMLRAPWLTQRDRFALQTLRQAWHVTRWWADVRVGLTESGVKIVVCARDMPVAATIDGNRLTRAAFELADRAEDGKYIPLYDGVTPRSLYNFTSSFGARGKRGTVDADAAVQLAVFGGLLSEVFA